MHYHGTDVDGPSFDPDTLNVRGRDLNELIREASYVAAIWHIFTGTLPSPDEAARLQSFLMRVPAAFPADHAAIRVTRLTARSGATTARAMSAGLMVDASALLGEVQREARLPELNDDAQSAIANFAVPPLLMSAALFDDDAAAPFRESPDYVSAMYAAASRRRFVSAAERRAFEAVLVALHGGFGVLPPTVQVPRSSIGTGAPMPHAFAAGYATAGPNHAGAAEESMKLLARIVEEMAGGDIRERAARAVTAELGAGRRIYGFGHPLFDADPRPPVLRALTIEIGLHSPYLDAWDALVEIVGASVGVKPNLDSIVAAISLTLGLIPAAGTGVFLCSRTAAMAAHAIERPATKPPFGVARRIARKILIATPKEDFAFTPY
jgi:citrate synthase